MAIPPRSMMSDSSDMEKLASIGRPPKRKRTVLAPMSWGLVGAPAVVSVTLEEDEDVIWHWTHFTDGRSMVTGYTIVKPGNGNRP
jgi:hypothetical protein